jgi:hypothetical protein
VSRVGWLEKEEPVLRAVTRGCSTTRVSLSPFHYFSLLFLSNPETLPAVLQLLEPTAFREAAVSDALVEAVASALEAPSLGPQAEAQVLQAADAVRGHGDACRALLS